MNHRSHVSHVEEKILLRNFSPRRELMLTQIGITFTFIASIMVAIDLGKLIATDFTVADFQSLIAHLLVSLIVVLLIYGSIVYQLTRLKYIQRLRDHMPASDKDLAKVYRHGGGSLLILVPSYKEEPSVVEMTLMSAALQDYPNRSIALLVDDPPTPKNAQDAELLAVMRRLPAMLEAKFHTPRHLMLTARADYLERTSKEELDLCDEYRRVGLLYEKAAEWTNEQIMEYPVIDSASRVFVYKVLYRRRTDLLQRARVLRDLADSVDKRNGADLSAAQCQQEYDRLVGLFDVNFSSFERKRYENLSHEANKAMNLNSYLGLMGKRFREVRVGEMLHLQEVSEGNADLVVPHADYVITLDADSILLPNYALRLAHFIEQPGHERIAVVQTPYSAFPDASSVLERIAGATTDIQYIIHQGFTGFNATYWVGANALLRRSALEDIVELDTERGFAIRRYIQDRTVIEDTESTIDLVVRGWELHNYPERLAYSATPRDFGSFLIQRRRWANGGLIILPKLLKRIFGCSANKASIGEAFMRLHYLISIAAVNIGLIILLAFPITSDVKTIWLPLTAASYFALYTRDLMQLGYHGSDLLRVYALNLMLIPINLGGVFKSIQQGITKTKIPFGRTPKVQGRTAAPVLYILAEYFLIALWMVGAGFHFATNQWTHGLFAMINALLLGYAIYRYLGLSASFEDISNQVKLPSWILPSIDNVASAPVCR